MYYITGQIPDIGAVITRRGSQVWMLHSIYKSQKALVTYADQAPEMNKDVRATLEDPLF